MCFVHAYVACVRLCVRFVRGVRALRACFVRGWVHCVRAFSVRFVRDVRALRACVLCVGGMCGVRG